MLRVTARLVIDERELEESFIRASGPGGQNVNKVASAVQLRFNLAESSFPEDVKQRLARLAGRRLTADGVLVIEASRFRTQERNREDARARLAALLEAATKAPKPRVATKPTRASKERRLGSKRQRAGIKRQRSASAWERE